MSLFRKLPVTVSAWQFNGEDRHDWPAWIKGHNDTSVHYDDHGTQAVAIDIHTLEGIMRASTGYWIIQGVQGELYPCKPDIFAVTYEPVGDAA